MESLPNITSITTIKNKLSKSYNKTKEELADLKTDLKEELLSRKEEFIDLKNDLEDKILQKKKEVQERFNRKDLRVNRREFPKDNRKDLRQDRPDRRNFFERKKDYIIKTFENIAQPVKAKNFVSNKYREFVKKVDTPTNRKLVMLLPYVLFALTVVAVNNKRVIKPLFDAFYTSKEKLKPGSSLVEKTLFIITEYLSVFTKGNLFTNIDLAMSTLMFLIDDIPGIYRKLDSYTGLSTFTMQKQLAKNLGDLNEEMVLKPERERQQRKERQEAQAEQYKFKEDMKKFYGMISNLSKTNKNINITMPKLPQNQQKSSQNKPYDFTKSSFFNVPTSNQGTQGKKNPNKGNQGNQGKPARHINKKHKRP